MSKDRQDRLAAGLRRAVEMQAHMRDGAGPQYEQVKSRSAIIKAAWRAAGSPPEVRAMGVPPPYGNGRWFLASSVRRRRGTEVRAQEATPEQVKAWQAWLGERHRLHCEFGWQLDDVSQAADRYRNEEAPTWDALLGLSKAVGNARKVGHSRKDITDATGMTSEELAWVNERVAEHRSWTSWPPSERGAVAVPRPE